MNKKLFSEVGLYETFKLFPNSNSLFEKRIGSNFNAVDKNYKVGGKQFKHKFPPSQVVYVKDFSQWKS